MKLSERALTWVMRLYPPFLFQRIWVRKFHKGYYAVDVRVHRSFLNRNSNGSIFGGTIFAATDPLYALLFGQLMRRKGYRTIVWLKSAQIRYIKPAMTSLNISVRITDEQVREVEQTLKNQGKFVKVFSIELVDRTGEVCAIAENEVYIRDLDWSREAGQESNQKQYMEK